MDRIVQAPDGMYIARGEMRAGCRPENSSTAADHGSRSLRPRLSDFLLIMAGQGRGIIEKLIITSLGPHPR
jgi:hypothetical protein